MGRLIHGRCFFDFFTLPKFQTLKFIPRYLDEIIYIKNDSGMNGYLY